MCCSYDFFHMLVICGKVWTLPLVGAGVGGGEGVGGTLPLGGGGVGPGTLPVGGGGGGGVGGGPI